MACSTPIVFLIFRRPDLTAQVFEVIRQIQPSKLLVIADGPRSEVEKKKCQEARRVTENIDWECEVLRNYSDSNMGSRVRVRSGLDWTFSQVEEALILEDDCLPHPSFFAYCEELLSYYREDERVWCISGNNFQDGNWRGKGSYYFSNYNHCWGWGTWRRAWGKYDNGLSLWPVFKDGSYLETILDSKKEVEYWHNIFDRLYTSTEPPNWDYGWTFTCWQNHGLTALPNINLVSNIGFRSDATNTKNKSSYANLPVNDIGEIRHPSFVVRDRAADMYTFDHVFGGLKMKKGTSWSARFQRIIKDFKLHTFNRR